MKMSELEIPTATDDLETIKKWLDDYITHGRILNDIENGGFVIENKSKEFLLKVSSLLSKVGVKSRLKYNIYEACDMYYLIIDYYECKGLNFIKRMCGPKYEFYTQRHDY